MTPFDETIIGERKISEEDGASYALDLCHASQLRFEERYNRVLALIKDFEKNFEHYYQGIYGDQKRILESLGTILKLNIFLLLIASGKTEKHPVRIILMTLI